MVSFRGVSNPLAVPAIPSMQAVINLGDLPRKQNKKRQRTERGVMDNMTKQLSSRVSHLTEGGTYPDYQLESNVQREPDIINSAGALRQFKLFPTFYRCFPASNLWPLKIIGGTWVYSPSMCHPRRRLNDEFCQG